MKFATINLLHWAKPGIYWHQSDEQRAHTPASWAAKTGWLAATLDAIDADVIAFQEVVSARELQYLCDQVGYREFACVTEPRFKSEEPDVYVNASLAVASRFPIVEAFDIAGFGHLIGDTILDSSAQFSRPALRVVLDMPMIGETVVYCVHFKSPGTRVDSVLIDAIEGEDAKLSRLFLERAQAGVDQVAKRAGEAAALYTRVRHDLSHDPQRPILVMGDFNDGPKSYTLDIITQRQPIRSVGSVGGDDLAEDVQDRARQFLLFDTFQWAVDPLPDRPITFRDPSSQKTETLDYVLVSWGLHPENPVRRATITDYQVHQSHFDNAVEAITTSDHAPVIVSLEPIQSK